MATMISGSQGGIVLPGVMGGNIVVFSWSGNLEHEIFEATPFETPTGAQSNWKTQSYGMYHLTGTCEGWMIDTAVPSIGDAGTLNASPTSGFKLFTRGGATAAEQRSYEFAGVISSMAMSVDQKAQATVTLSFESSGAVTLVVGT